MTLSERIRFFMKKKTKEEKSITQAELAAKLEIAPASVNKWLSGGTPSVDKLPVLCELLGITPNELFGYEQDELPQEAVDLYKAFQKYPEYKPAISKLLDMIASDMENK